MWRLENSTFNGASKLENINLPYGIVSMGNSVFSKTAIETLVLPASLLTISPASFHGMDNIETLVIRRSSSQGITSTAIDHLFFSRIPTRILVPNDAASLHSYRVAPGWRSFANRIFANSAETYLRHNHIANPLFDSSNEHAFIVPNSKAWFQFSTAGSAFVEIFVLDNNQRLVLVQTLTRGETAILSGNNKYIAQLNNRHSSNDMLTIATTSGDCCCANFYITDPFFNDIENLMLLLIRLNVGILAGRF